MYCTDIYSNLFKYSEFNVLYSSNSVNNSLNEHFSSKPTSIFLWLFSKKIRYNILCNPYIVLIFNPLYFFYTVVLYYDMTIKGEGKPNAIDITPSHALNA